MIDAFSTRTHRSSENGEPMNEKSPSERISDVMSRCVDTAENSIDGRIVDVTAGIDVTDRGFEVEIVGWTDDEESWSIAHLKIDGCLESSFTWEALRLVLEGMLETADTGVKIDAVCIDSGGHHTQKVYDFARANAGRAYEIWAVKGAAANQGNPPIWPLGRDEQLGTFRPVIIGVNAAKDVIQIRLLLEQPGPGFMHFPHNHSADYFAQLISERLVAKVVNGQRFRVWELAPGQSNGALDCRIYAYAALLGLRLKRSISSAA
nr:terminase gpA endonuclease subunit [Burkholderia ubonensis]